MGSYERVWREIDSSVANSFLCNVSSRLIVGVSGFISYVIVRKSNVWSGTLDSLLIVPYIVPGVVMAIGFVVSQCLAFGLGRNCLDNRSNRFIRRLHMVCVPPRQRFALLNHL